MLIKDILIDEDLSSQVAKANKERESRHNEMKKQADTRERDQEKKRKKQERVTREREQVSRAQNELRTQRKQAQQASSS
jgi:hypothetical protein|tara:strand:+ start:323 stop:559 length:237 start_codon:yes stop_codon:yes gene_type:complete